MKYDISEMQNHPSPLEGFTRHYADGNPPWDIGRPQPPFLEIADRVVGPVLDAGCGTGGTALFFAAHGLEVTGIDFVEEAILRAQARAAEADLRIEFLVKDAMTLATWDRRFASVIDSGLFHIYDGDDRLRYVQGLTHVTKPGGCLFLLTFTEEAEEGGASQDELRKAFSESWNVESITPVIGDINPVFKAQYPDTYAGDGPKLWFAVIRRQT